MPPSITASGTFAPTTTAATTIHTFTVGGVYVLRLDATQLDGGDVLRIDFLTEINAAQRLVKRDELSGAQTPVGTVLGPYVVASEDLDDSSPPVLQMAQSTGGDGSDDFWWTLIRVSTA